MKTKPATFKSFKPGDRIIADRGGEQIERGTVYAYQDTSELWVEWDNGRGDISLELLRRDCRLQDDPRFLPNPKKERKVLCKSASDIQSLTRESYLAFPFDRDHEVINDDRLRQQLDAREIELFPEVTLAFDQVIAGLKGGKRPCPEAFTLASALPPRLLILLWKRTSDIKQSGVDLPKFVHSHIGHVVVQVVQSLAGIS
jgi:hypothetical protein